MNERIYTAYAEDNDITFIMKETTNTIDNVTILEVVGFYGGKPKTEFTKENIGFTRSEF